MSTFDLSTVPRHSEPVTLSSISRTTCRAEAQRIDQDGKVIASAPASGFFWRHLDRCFLVTNRHVLSGIDAFTGKLMGFVPNNLKILVFVERPHDEGVEMASMNGNLVLLDEFEQQIWRDHPSGREVDVALLEVDPSVGDGFEMVCLNGTGIQLDQRPFVGDELFLVGYPEGNSYDRRMPLWKRGSLATDPDLSQMGLPQLFVDTLGTKGLSGSPVISRANNIDSTLIKSKKNEAQFFNFLGIYAGRLGEKGLNSQIGRVYKASVLDDILSTVPSRNRKYELHLDFHGGK